MSTPSHTHKHQALFRTSWRPYEMLGQRQRWQRLLKRIVITALLVLLVSYLISLLVSPFLHPDSHFYYLYAPDGQSNATPPLKYTYEDYIDFLPLEQAVISDPSEEISLPLLPLDNIEELDQRLDDLERMNLRSTDTLILFVRAHGIVQDEKSYLACRDFNPSDPGQGLFQVSSLVSRLRQTAPTTKLLIIDTGPVPYDERVGMMARGFPHVLQQEIESANDPSLWVMCSNGPMQHSLESPALRRSVFGYMVAQGLTGSADQDGDDQVSVRELFRFTRGSVSTWVEQATRGAQSQTPLLFHAGTSGSVADPILLSVAGISDDLRASSVVASITQAQNTDQQWEIGERVRRRFAQTEMGYRNRVSMLLRGKDQQILNRVKVPLPAEVPAANDLAPTNDGSPMPSTNDGSPKPSAGKNETGSDADASADAQPRAANGGQSAEPLDRVPSLESLLGESDTDEEDAAANQAAFIKVADLLLELWTLRDRLQQAEPGRPRPVDYAPLHWRRFQADLMWHDQLHRAGAMARQVEIQAELERFVASSKQLLGQAPATRRRRMNSLDRLALSKPRRNLSLDRLESLAIAEQLMEQGILAADEGFVKRAAEFDTAIAATDRGPLDAWLDQEHPPYFEQFYEYRLAVNLSSHYDIPWEVTQLALRARRLGEQAAAPSQVGDGWIDPLMRRADNLRLQGERMLEDRVDHDWTTQSAAALRESIELYQQGLQQLDVVHRAEQLRNDLLQRASWYVRWHCGQMTDVSPLAPRHDDVSELVDSLTQLVTMLASPANTSLVDLQMQYERLTRLQSLVESPLDERNIEVMTEPPFPGADSASILNALVVPVATADARQKLLDVLAAVDITLVQDFDWSLIVPVNTDRARVTTSDEWQTLLRQLGLQIRLARLATLSMPTTTGASLDRLRTRLDQQIERLETTPASSISRELWALYEESAEQIAACYEELPGAVLAVQQQNRQLDDEASRRERVARLNGAELALRIVDPRDAPRLDSLPLMQDLDAARWYDHIRWRRQRYQRFLDDADTPTRAYLNSLVELGRQLALNVPGQPVVTAPRRPPLSITGAEWVSLADQDRAGTAVTIQNQSSEPLDIQVVVDYDDQLIQTILPVDRVVRRRRQLQENAPTDYPVRPPAGESTMRLDAGQSETISLDIRRRARGTTDTRLIVRAISPDAYVRHEIQLGLPGTESVQLLSGDHPSSWQKSDDGIVLHPLPNRPSQCHLLLSNRSPRERQVDVAIIVPSRRPSLTIPQGELEREVAARVLERFAPESTWKEFTGVVLPATGEPVALRPPPKPDDADSAGQANAGAAQPESPRSIRHGLLAVISDRQSGKMTIRRIDFSPQRPRRYLQPAVGYNSSLEQIEIEVAATDPSLVPASGIRVQCEFTEQLPPGTEAQLDGIVAAPDYKAKLFARVPARLARVYTAMLHVDDYPRAFLYQIPCTIQSNNLSELNDVMDIRIIAPQAGTRLKAPAEGIEARIEVDAPLGSFPANQRRDFIDVGVDADRDRELQNDPSIRLYCDRQVEIIGEGLDANGVLAFTAKVQDYQLLVPCPGLINVRANLLARLNVSTTGRWSKDIEVVLDATPPQIDRVELTPGRAVAAEQDLELSVWASDANLSGVRQVEVALDKDGSGDFGEVNQPVAAKSTTGIRWSASLATKDVPLGPAVVLIRATDRVGNVSKVRTELIQLVAASEVPSTSSPTTGTVTGVVTFLGVPIPDARVQLTPTQATTTAANPAAATNSADAAQPPQPQEQEAKTDETGTFRLENVAPGQYTVTAKGLARNRVRKVTQEVTVEPGRLRLLLETR